MGLRAGAGEGSGIAGADETTVTSGAGRLLRPANLLRPIGDHLLTLGRPFKFRSLCRDYLLGCLTVRLPTQRGSNPNSHRD
jgi:hypothetical protein